MDGIPPSPRICLCPLLLLVVGLPLVTSDLGRAAEEPEAIGDRVSETGPPAEPGSTGDDAELPNDPDRGEAANPELDGVLPTGPLEIDVPVTEELGLLPPDDVGLEDPLLRDPGPADDPFLVETGESVLREPDVEWGPIGLGQSARQLPDFEAGILGNELLIGGYQTPLGRQGFRYGVGAQFIYDSNLFLEQFSAQSDLSFVVSPSIEFRSAPEGVPGLFTFSYTPFIRQYFSVTELNTIDQAAKAAVSFNGARGSFEMAANYGRFSNADRYVGGRVETETFLLNASSVYQLASRTSLEASLAISTSNDSGQSQGGIAGVPPGVGAVLPSNRSEFLQFQMAAYWQATPKTRFGPSLRYATSSSDTIGDRDTLAFLLVADYVPSERLSVYASAGIEGVSYASAQNPDSTDFTGSFGIDYRPNDRFVLGADLSYQAIPAQSDRVSRSGGGDQSLTGGLSISYLPNPDWSFEFGITADAFPAADSTNYSVGDLSYRATVARSLGEGSLALTGSLGFSEYESVGNVAVARGDEEFRALSLSYRHPAFGGRGQFDCAIRWSDSSGQLEWDRLQVTAGVTFGF